MSRVKKTLIVGIIVVFAIGFLRECGFAEAYYATGNYKHVIEVGMKSSEVFKNHRTTKNTEQSIHGYLWSVTPDSNVLSPMDLEGKANEGAENGVNFTVSQFECSGPWVLPLTKSGACSYTATANGSNDLRGAYAITLEGEFEFQMNGIVSASILKQALAREMAADVNTQVNGLIKEE